MKKILILIFSYLLFNIINISSSFSSDVDKVRDLANSKPFVIEDKTASQLANQFLSDAGVSIGWDDDRNFYIAKASAYSAIKDPNVPNFLDIRAIKTFEANITAKSEIISFIRTELSAEDIVKIPSIDSSVKISDKVVAQENSSTVKTFSSMPLVGAFQVAHFESFVDGQYEVTVILMWNVEQENRVFSLLNGKKIQLEPSTISLKDYIKNTNWASTIGGRKFIDDKGEFYLFGIGAAPLKGKTSAHMKTSKGKSELYAQKELAIALKGDIQLNRLAKDKMQEIIDKDGSVENVTSSSFAETISQKLDGLKIKGASKRYSDVLSHPLTGHKMFVTVYSLSMSSSNVKKSKPKLKKIKKVKNSSENNSNQNPVTPSEASKRSKLTVVSTSVEGIGLNKKEAIRDGLLQAISQVNGIQMSSESSTMMKSFETVSDGNENFASASSFQEKIKQSTKGVVQSWKIISMSKTGSGKMFKANLDVNISKLQLSDDLKRMRIVISSPEINSTVKNTSKAKKFNSTFSKNLNKMLTNSNRFAILDRKNTQAISKELKMIASGNFRVEETAKLGNKVAADYLLISSLNEISNKKIYKKLMGENISITKSKASVSINIIDIATSQIIFSDDFNLSQSGGSINSLAKIISNRLSRKITDTFYPAKVIAKDGKKIVVDQGKSFFNKKTKYKLLRLGGKVIDQTTGKYSARVEKEVADLIFISGSPKQSKLKIDNEKINLKNLKFDGSFLVRPIFKSLPTEDEIAKQKLKKVKTKSKKMMKKIDKDKDW